MKFFFIFFAAITALTGAYWIFDAPGSGAGLATAIFGSIAVGVGIYNTIKFGGPLNEAPKQ